MGALEHGMYDVVGECSVDVCVRCDFGLCYFINVNFSCNFGAF